MTLRRLEDDFNPVILREAYAVKHTDGETYIVGWAEIYNKYFPYGTEVDPCLTVLTLDGYCLDSRAEDTKRAVKLAAMNWKVAQIRQEMGLVGEVTDFETIRAVLQRVWAGEWMGQFNSGNVIYFQELGDILGTGMKGMHDLAQQLAQARIADILPSTWILSAPEGDTPSDGTEEAYGHKKFTSSSFGYWGCRECGKSGDDWSNPSDYPCEAEQEAV